MGNKDLSLACEVKEEKLTNQSAGQNDELPIVNNPEMNQISMDSQNL
jgi:hypothetical protein